MKNRPGFLVSSLLLCSSIVFAQQPQPQQPSPAPATDLKVKPTDLKVKTTTMPVENKPKAVAPAKNTPKEPVDGRPRKTQPQPQP